MELTAFFTTLDEGLVKHPEAQLLVKKLVETAKEEPLLDNFLLDTPSPAVYAKMALLRQRQRMLSNWKAVTQLVHATIPTPQTKRKREPIAREDVDLAAANARQQQQLKSHGDDTPRRNHKRGRGGGKGKGGRGRGGRNKSPSFGNSNGKGWGWHQQRPNGYQQPYGDSQQGSYGQDYNQGQAAQTTTENGPVHTRLGKGKGKGKGSGKGNGHGKGRNPWA